MRRFPFNRSNSGRPIYFNRDVGYGLNRVGNELYRRR
nr:MAG TPA: hypothetical protein [Caudoviricetes sp.]